MPIDYKSISPMQSFEVYPNSKPVMQKSILCNDDCGIDCKMGIYREIRNILNMLFKDCLIYNSEYGIYSEYNMKKIQIISSFLSFP